jgi:hypothetical protein
MKVLEFIKKNISVFSVLGFLFLLLSIVIYITSINQPDYHGYAEGFSYIIFILSLFILTLDFILKQIINDRKFFNLIEGILFIPIIILFFKLFIT